MSEFTKGPWQWSDDGNLYPVADLVRYELELKAETYDFWPTAIVETDGGHYAPFGADRHLIAAAPDMYEALERIAKAPDGITAAELRQVAHEALAKSRGES